METQWSYPMRLAFDPFTLDNYGMPWLYHMYPVNMQQFYQQPKKYKTQRGRKRPNASSSPNKSTRSPSAKEQPAQDLSDVKQQNPTRSNTVPFARQLDEIARTTAVRSESKEKHASDLSGKDCITMPPRNGRPLRQLGNGLYDTFGRGRYPVGMPIESTVPFPDPVPPSGSSLGYGRTKNTDIGFSGLNQYSGGAIQSTSEGCGNFEIERAAEWGGNICNSCEPDH